MSYNNNFLEIDKTDDLEIGDNQEITAITDVYVNKKYDNVNIIKNDI